jgi:hypothetical protein
MANSSGGGSKRKRPAVAIVVSLVAHILVLAILASTRPSLTDNTVGPPAVSVDLVRPERPEPRRQTSNPPAAGATRGTTHPETPPHAPNPREMEANGPPMTPDLPMAPAAPKADERLSAALRGSLLGCAEADAARLTPSERQHCHDAYAQRNREGPVFGVDPKALAVFDANERRANFMTQPFLSAAPKNGCRPVITHKDYYVPNTSKEDMTVALACGKSF